MGRGTRHVPERRCLGCGRRSPKAALARFRAAPAADGSWVLERDDAGHRGGRGLYVCRVAECFERASRRRAFVRAARLSGAGLRVEPTLAEGLGGEVG